jgi:sugar lactone lactonase YvrE
VRFTAVPASTDVYALGEGPLWDPTRGRLLWVDIVAGTVHEGVLAPETGAVIATGRRSFPTTVGAVAASSDGRLLVAEESSLALIDSEGNRTELARVLPRGVRSRLNDGAVDPAGRFLIGSLAQDGRRNQEVLARLEESGCVLLDTDLTLSNGLAWSPAGDRFYSIDTIPGTVWVRDYEPVTGRVGPRRELFAVTDGSPDGLCVDAEGNLWIALWGRGRVECRSTRGDLLAVVDVDAPHTSSAVFAGPDLDVLVITTATQGLAEKDLAEHPDSGRLFTAKVGVRGLPTPAWVPPAALHP